MSKHWGKDSIGQDFAYVERTLHTMAKMSKVARRNFDLLMLDGRLDDLPAPLVGGALEYLKAMLPDTMERWQRIEKWLEADCNPTDDGDTT